MKHLFNHVVLGGTFDHFHKGHKKLIDLAFQRGNKISLGITSDSFVKGKLLSDSIETFVQRKKEVENYLKKKKYYSRAKIVKISDIYGPTLENNKYDALLASKDTYLKAIKINSLRERKGLKKLKIIIAPAVLADDGKIISSERIRMGEIDREGNSHINIFKNSERLILPENLRPTLRIPLGQVVEGGENNIEQTAIKTLRLIDKSNYIMVITVGDIVTMSLFNIGFDPDVKIIDLRSRRKDINYDNHNFLASELASRHSVGTVRYSSQLAQREARRNLLAQTSTCSENSDYLNEPATINSKTVSAISSAIKIFFKKSYSQLIIIKGEEDLLTLPAILLAPLCSVVLYGQVDLGVVAVEVTEEKKKEVKKILSKFC